MEVGIGTVRTLTVSNGTLTVGGAIGDGTNTLGLTKAGAGTLQLDGACSYGGATAVNAGKMLFNGTHSGGGDWTVQSGATLGGGGTISAAATIYGVISPGTSDAAIGQLNIGGNVTWRGAVSWSANTDWKFDLGAANAADLLNITGDFTKNTSSGSAFRFDFGGFAGSGTFTLAQWTGSTTFNAGDFSYVNLGTGNRATFQIDTGSSPRTLKVVIDSCATPPSLTLGASPTVCKGTTSATVPTTATNGSPDQYSIDYSDTANIVGGFVDVQPTALVSPIPITVLNVAPVGVYTGTLYAIISSTGCRFATNFTVTVLDAPATPGGISGSSSVCANDTGLSYSIAAVSMATGYTWGISGGTITATNGAGTQITVNWGAAGSGRSITVNAANSCGISDNQTLSVTVLSAAPGSPAASAATDVSMDSFVANWTAGSGTIAGYRLDVATSVDFTSGYVVSNLSVSGLSYTLSGLESGETYYYRVRAYNACGASGNSGAITVLTPMILAAWDVSGLAGGSGNYGADPLSPTSYATSQVTVVGLSRGPNVTQDGTAAARGWGGTAWNSANAGNAVTAGQYATCVVEAVSGRSVSFISVSKLDYRRPANGPANGVLQYSVGGGAYVNITTLSYSSSSDSGGSIAVPIDLSGIGALQGVAAATPVVFRIVNYGASGAAEPWYIYDTANSSAHDFEIRGVVCATPVAYGVSGGGSYCSGGSGVAVGLSGSQLRVSYQLYRNNGGSPVAVGSPRGGTGGSISFGLQTAADTYTVKATRNSGGCTADMTGSVTVSITQTPGAPQNPLVTATNSGQVNLSWEAPAGTVTGYNVKRSTTEGGPYANVTGGSNVPGLTFSDTSAINGNTYYYIITALNSGCEGTASGEVSAVMPNECPPGYAPTMAKPANQAVIVGGAQLLVNVTVSDSSAACPSPTMVNSTLPSGMATSDSTGTGSRTRQFTWVPGIGDVGTYPITVMATDSENLSTSVTFIVYVGEPGESGNPPQSQTNWNVAITNLVVPSSGNATVVWTSVDGVQYDVYSSALPINGGASWTKVLSAQEADGTLSTASVSAAGSMIFYQVVPQGQSAQSRGVWGIVKPTLGAFSMLAPPVNSDRRFDGEFGAALAAAVPVNTYVHIMTPGTEPTWTTLRRNASAQWRTEPGNAVYATPLEDGQAFFIEGASGSTPVFSGPVGNDGTSSQQIKVGYNILGISEGKGLPVATAFSSASPVGNNNEQQADQIILQNSNGSWRRLVRLANNTWYDMSTGTTSTLTLMPGQAYYYIRRNSDTTVSF